jgi:uncharacterized protein (DUF433 family)
VTSNKQDEALRLSSNGLFSGSPFVTCHWTLVTPSRKETMMATIRRDPEILRGTPVFSGTRVPFQDLLDYLEGGESPGEFLDNFPTVTREQAIMALGRSQAV